MYSRDIDTGTSYTKEASVVLYILDVDKLPHFRTLAARGIRCFIAFTDLREAYSCSQPRHYKMRDQIGSGQVRGVTT